MLESGEPLERPFVVVGKATLDSWITSGSGIFQQLNRRSILTRPAVSLPAIVSLCASSERVVAGGHCGPAREEALAMIVAGLPGSDWAASRSTSMLKSFGGRSTLILEALSGTSLELCVEGSWSSRECSSSGPFLTRNL